MINSRFKNKQAGFTILESIVAILVLSLAISGVFASVQQSLSQTTIAKEEVQAFYLAQEAVEIIRNQRDANRLSTIVNGTPTNWLNGIAAVNSDPCYFGKTCEADATGPGGVYLYSCSGGWDSCDFLRQNSSNFLYGYDNSWLLTNIKREIKLEQVNTHEISIVVRITWSKGLINKEFKIKTELFNW
jgi:prepilin-type N-terminal cleavage/methylation domain-containing protein